MVLPQKMARTSQTVKHLHNQFLDLRKTDALTSDAINLQTKSFAALVVLSVWRPVRVGGSLETRADRGFVCTKSLSCYPFFFISSALSLSHASPCSVPRITVTIFVL